MREGFNDIQIRMKGFKKWGVTQYTLWCSRPPVYDIVEAKATVTIVRDVGEPCREQLLYYKSEPMPMNRPVFKDRLMSNLFQGIGLKTIAISFI